MDLASWYAEVEGIAEDTATDYVPSLRPSEPEKIDPLDQIFAPDEFVEAVLSKNAPDTLEGTGNDDWSAELYHERAYDRAIRIAKNIFRDHSNEAEQIIREIRADIRRAA